MQPPLAKNLGSLCIVIDCYVAVNDGLDADVCRQMHQSFAQTSGTLAAKATLRPEEESAPCIMPRKPGAHMWPGPATQERFRISTRGAQMQLCREAAENRHS